MKKNYLILLFLIVSTTPLFAQIKFEKGYFISTNNEKTNCYIKNVDWVNNPVDFEYKLTLEGDSKTGRISSIKEFSVPTIFKYQKHTVQVDMSTSDLSKLNYDKKPEWKEQTVFLNVLIEGKASLYRYKNGSLSKLFYKKDNNQIKQLIKKSYLSKDGELAENNEYRQQLYTDLVCESILRKRVSRLRYNKNDLTQFFIAYNTCKNDDFIAFKQETKGKWNLRLNLGISNQKTIIKTEGFGQSFDNDIESEANWSPRLGVDLEYVF